MNEASSSSLWIVVVRSPRKLHGPYTLDDAALATGVHRDLLLYYCRAGLLGAQRASGESEPEFDDHTLYDVRRLDRLRRNHGVNLRALPLVSQLTREVERLRTEVRVLRMLDPS